MSEETHDVTSEDLPTLEPTTREKIKQGVASIGTVAAALGTAAAALLLIDKLVRRFKEKKTVTVTVSENHPWTEVPSSPEA